MFDGGKTPVLPARELGSMGYRIGIYPSQTHRAALAAAKRVLAGSDDIWMPVVFVQDDIPPPKAPLPAIAVQIIRMSIMERVKTAILGGKDARMILANDSNRVVRRYVLTTGTAALLLALAHLARILAEGTHLLGQPAFLLATLASIGIGIWAILLLRKPSGRDIR